MQKLWATIIKDFKVLTRDKVGLAFMFAMPILLVVIITSLQASTFELVNDNKISMLLCNNDEGKVSEQFIETLNKLKLFEITVIPKHQNQSTISQRMFEKDALITVVIPSDFSSKINAKTEQISNQALNDFGVSASIKESTTPSASPLLLYYNPVLQKSYRQSIHGGLQSALQIVESKQMLHTLYSSLNANTLPPSLEENLLNSRSSINELPISKNNSKTIPNATQHNIPAWTIFAMFFIVTSLGSNLVKEKISGSFIRLKTLPTNYLLALVSKQITYMVVCLSQVVVIFALGVFLFPLIGLPALNLPKDITPLFIASFICGWCAISYAICIGVFAQTQEQANGFGAVSVVILAALGGILVPSFAMPSSFQLLLNFSPLHWCLNSYYLVFLEGGNVHDVLINSLPLLGIIVLIHGITLFGLRRKNLI